MVVNFFAWRWTCAVFCWSYFALHCRMSEFAVGLSQFFVCWRRRGKFFVELAWLTFWFNVGLAQFFVGVALSEFPVGLSQFFVLAAVGKMFG